MVMNAATQTAEQLRRQILGVEDQLKKLKEQLAEVEARNEVQTSLDSLSMQDPVTNGKWPLSSEEYKRYGRQMIVPSIGIKGKTLL